MSEPSAVRSPGISYQALLDTDSRAVPAVLRLEAPPPRVSEDVGIERYVSRAYHERETARLWSRVWQFACREEQIPAAGDYLVYEIGLSSYLIVRGADGRIRCFVNACLHRGRQLKHYDGRCSEIRCPYHGFAWHTDGSLKQIPADWDFPQIVASEFSLPEARVDTWAGFVFINPDPSAAPLAAHLGDLPQHFARWNLQDRYIEGHVVKVIRANWKIAQEAFCEALHVNATHPQALPYLGDTNSQVDVWETFSRVITPGGTPSPLLDWSPAEDDVLRYMLDVREDAQMPLTAGDGTARRVSADAARERWRPIVGAQVDDWSDAEFIDNLDYTLFPNFHPWGAFNRIVYRFRPNADDHRSSLMEVMLLAPFAGDRPPPAAPVFLDADQSWTEAEALGLLGKVFDQDTFNMERVQKGLETTRKPGVTLAGYQEGKIRWLNDSLDRWLAEP